jgi:hypothetical protein
MKGNLATTPSTTRIAFSARIDQASKAARGLMKLVNRIALSIA